MCIRDSYWTTPEQEAAALATRDAFQEVLRVNGFGEITTEIRAAVEAGEFYLAEDYHQGLSLIHIWSPTGHCPNTSALRSTSSARTSSGPGRSRSVALTPG